MASTPALGATGSMPASSGPASSTAASWRPPNPASRPSTELPKIKDQRLLYFGAAGAAVTAWSLFVMWAMSAEKASSSVMRTITFNLRSSPLVKEALGEGIRPRPFLAGEPWVHGKVNTVQGIVDIHFRVETPDGRKGTVYFVSERPNKAGRFETKEFKLLVDGSQQSIDLLQTEMLL
ncbi:MAG: hypothetical protein CYPHOPRED_003195 [Cyphobasidiales sp. Tagirdzhanova-0007]|nr:MAG: hypothetical protein CYPHOPRED_003195 [Cyphobasidiales sp. Tagirdzhanova-0007]